MYDNSVCSVPLVRSFDSVGILILDRIEWARGLWNRGAFQLPNLVRIRSCDLPALNLETYSVVVPASLEL